MRGCVHKRGDSWGFVVEMGKHPITGKRKQKSQSGFASKVQAQTELNTVLHELNLGSYIVPTIETVASHFQYWLQQKKSQIREGTFGTYSWVVNFHIIPNLGNVNLDKLTPQQVLNVYDRLQNGARKLAPQTIKHIHKVLHDGMETAFKWGLIKKNIMKLLKSPKVPRAEMKVWNEVQIAHFLESTKDSRYYIIYLLAATTGMRKGEVLGLKWSDIDLASAKLSVRRSYVRGIKGFIFQEPKTAAGVRVVSLPNQTVKALEQHKFQQEQINRPAGGSDYIDNGLVVPTLRGTPMNPQQLEEAWAKVFEQTGLPRIRFHDLRHSHASLLLKAGVHIKVVSERLGHSSVTITLDRYSHLLPGMQESAAVAFNDLVFGSSSGSKV